MIYTLTLNPAIDMNLMTDGVYPQRVNRTFDGHYSPNGKGINVSFVLDYYQVSSKILGFFGGFSGDWVVKQSQAKQIQVYPIRISEPTRINSFLFDGVREYKFVNVGPLVEREQQMEMITLLRELKDMDYLTINGSLPLGIADTYFEEILTICAEKQTKVILDISSAKLKELLAFTPYLIKPNEEEIEVAFGIIMRDEADVIDVLKYLIELGAQNVLLTLGKDGAYFYNQKNIYYVGVKKVNVVSSACAGDAALGAFLSVWLKDSQNLEKALKRSAAMGASVAESQGLGDFCHVEEYFDEIAIRLVE